MGREKILPGREEELKTIICYTKGKPEKAHNREGSTSISSW